MQHPPFRLLASADAASVRASPYVPHGAPACCAASEPDAEDAAAAAASGRPRLADLDANFYCSVIGTCLTTAELRKLMARFVDTKGASDLDIHHDAVRLASADGNVAKALQKALDHRHAPVIQRMAKLADAEALAAHWDEALHQGEIPGAYWAVLMHRKATPALRQRVFGDVHMLSHLVGAAHRADIRRLAALERDNVDLREKLERQQLRSQELAEAHERQIVALRRELIEARADAASSGDGVAGRGGKAGKAERAERAEEAEKAAALIGVQTARRERAEQAAAAAEAEAARLAETLEHLRHHAEALGRELAATELQLKMNAGEAVSDAGLDQRLRSRRVLYVGGRPSSYPAIRDLVQRHGGEFRRHGGGLEDRAGLLAAAVGWADVVVFPVDCIDHESADNLKRLCARQQVPYMPLRSAGIGCFAAAFSGPAEGAGGGARGPSSICPRHG